MSLNKLFVAGLFLIAPFLANAYTEVPKATKCFSCESSDGVTIWRNGAKTQSTAKINVAKACRSDKGNGAKACKTSSCETFDSYLDTTCEIATYIGSASSSSSDTDVYVPPTTPNPIDDDSCSSDYECTGFDICARGKCVSKGSFDNRCFSNMDCSFPSQCLNGKCGTAGRDGCTSNHQCSGFDICVSGNCVSQNSHDNRCHSDFDCPTFSKCESWKCVTHP